MRCNEDVSNNMNQYGVCIYVYMHMYMYIYIFTYTRNIFIYIYTDQIWVSKCLGLSIKHGAKWWFNHQNVLFLVAEL